MTGARQLAGNVRQIDGACAPRPDPLHNEKTHTHTSAGNLVAREVWHSCLRNAITLTAGCRTAALTMTF